MSRVSSVPEIKVRDRVHPEDKVQRARHDFQPDPAVVPERQEGNNRSDGWPRKCAGANTDCDPSIRGLQLFQNVRVPSRDV